MDYQTRDTRAAIGGTVAAATSQRVGNGDGPPSGHWVAPCIAGRSVAARGRAGSIIARALQPPETSLLTPETNHKLYSPKRGGCPMKSQGGISYSNAAVASCPKHLLQFAVDQRYDDYTSVDHAVWRFIMRQNTFFLKEYAHKVYFQGLLNTGISFERIPRIEEMNDILAKIGWGAVAVDGFIPPAAFMEFQAYKVLVIACDMRQIHHIEYTPAPDIVHEAAGHAPIIVDHEYSKYLQRFGEVGAKAMSSKKDFELYQAIRHLSILKERPNADPKEVEDATKLVEHRQKTLGAPSEMSLHLRLHWGYVENALIGTLENPRI